MNVPEVDCVELAPEETEYRQKMEQEFSKSSSYSGHAAHQLFKSLCARNAIPQVRLDYLTKPYPGGHGKSHKDNFENHGCRGEAILEHPLFVPYLRYFIDGPALPATTIAGFRKILIEDAGTTGMVMDQLCRFVRAETRRLRLERSTARDEFWKLAREVDYPHADTIRNAAGSAGK